MIKSEHRIEEPEITRDSKGRITAIRLVFGPHHFVDVYRDGDAHDGRVRVAIGATHHGVGADAADVPSEFEKMVEQLMNLHPTRRF
jgi:hypothetical protein